MNDIWSNVLLILNALLWVVTFVVYQRTRKVFGIGSGLLFLYALISLICVHFYNNPYASGMFEKIAFFPFLYLYLMILLISFPILLLKEERICYIQFPNRILFNVVCIVIIILSCISLPYDIVQIKEGLINLILDPEYGKEAYMERAEAFVSKSKSNMDILSILGNMARNTAPVFFMYCLTLEKKSKFVFYGLFVSSALYPLTSISSGARSGLMISVMNILFLFLFIRNFLPANIKKNIEKKIYMMFVLLIIPFFLVTFSRTGGDLNDTFSAIERYASEGFLRFNNYGLDSNGCRNGDYTIVVFKKILGLDPAMYYSSRISKYSYMSMNESVFYTFVGDFTLDYGPIVAFLIFVVISLYFYVALKVRKGHLLFYQYILLYLLIVWCVGYFQFILGRIEGNLQMFTLLFLSLLFRIDSLMYREK